MLSALAGAGALVAVIHAGVNSLHEQPKTINAEWAKANSQDKVRTRAKPGRPSAGRQRPGVEHLSPTVQGAAAINHAGRGANPPPLARLPRSRALVQVRQGAPTTAPLNVSGPRRLNAASACCGRQYMRLCPALYPLKMYAPCCSPGLTWSSVAMPNPRP